MRPTCRAQVPGDDIAPQVAAGEIPHCRICNNDDPSAPQSDSDSDADELEHACARGVLKPDITFFGEYLPERVNDCLNEDLHCADLLLVLGTSLQVAPVARIPQYFPPHIPRLLVNRELVDYRFDVELLGNCDAVIPRIRRELGWDRAPGARVTVQAPGSDEAPAATPVEGSTAEREDPYDCTFVPPRRFLFAGATVSPGEADQDERGLGSSLAAMLNGLDDEGSSSGEENGKGDVVIPILIKLAIQRKTMLNLWYSYVCVEGNRLIKAQLSWAFSVLRRACGRIDTATYFKLF